MSRHNDELLQNFLAGLTYNVPKQHHNYLAQLLSKLNEYELVSEFSDLAKIERDEAYINKIVWFYENRCAHLPGLLTKENLRLLINPRILSIIRAISYERCSYLDGHVNLQIKTQIINRLIQFAHHSEQSDELIFHSVLHYLACLQELSVEKEQGKTEKADLSLSLREAILFGDLEKIASLAEQGEDLDQPCLCFNDAKIMPLHAAAMWDDLSMAQLLLKYKANPNIKTVDSDNDINDRTHQATPLHFAKSRNMIKLLLAHNANLEARTQEGLTPLHIAAGYCPETIIITLLEAGANPKQPAGSPSIFDLAKSGSVITTIIKNTKYKFTQTEIQTELDNLLRRIKQKEEVNLEKVSGFLTEEMGPLLPYYPIRTCEDVRGKYIGGALKRALDTVNKDQISTDNTYIYFALRYSIFSWREGICPYNRLRDIPHTMRLTMRLFPKETFWVAMMCIHRRCKIEQTLPDLPKEVLIVIFKLFAELYIPTLEMLQEWTATEPRVSMLANA